MECKEKKESQNLEVWFRSLKRRLIFTLLLIFIANLAFPIFITEASQYKRIVSLSPSTTEILFSLGLDKEIIGVTNYCDYPEEAKGKDKVGGMSNPSIESIISLRPDIVVMTVDGNPKEVEEKLRSMRIKTYVFRARRLDELPKGLREMGIVLGVRERAELLALELEETISKFRSDFDVGRKKKVLFILWPEPLIVAGTGTAIDDAIRLLGAENIAAGSGLSYPKYSIEDVIRHSPDVIIIGRSMGRDIREASRGLLDRLRFLPAVKNGKVFYVGDGLYRLGPRVIKGIEEIARCLR